MPRHGHQKGRANSPGRGERAGEAQSDSRGSAAGAALLVPGLTRLRLVLGLLVATVVGSALAVGAVHAVVLLVVAPLAIAAFLSGTWGHTIRSSVPAPALIAAAFCNVR